MVYGPGVNTAARALALNRLRCVPFVLCPPKIYRTSSRHIHSQMYCVTVHNVNGLLVFVRTCTSESIEEPNQEQRAKMRFDGHTRERVCVCVCNQRLPNSIRIKRVELSFAEYDSSAVELRSGPVSFGPLFFSPLLRRMLRELRRFLSNSST